MAQLIDGSGPELLTRVEELSDASKSELVRECGDVSTKEDGGERLNFTAFYEALLEAKGVSLDEPGQGRGTGGRKLRYETKVQFNGNLPVGKAYNAQLGLQPGEGFEIKLGRPDPADPHRCSRRGGVKRSGPAAVR